MVKRRIQLPAQSSKLQPVEQSPFRAYAREAVMARVDQVRGVLTRRIAQYLLNQVRCRDRRPTTTLDRVMPGERDFYMTLARGVLAGGDAIQTTEPPSAGELYRYERDKAMALARGRARIDAATLQHRLDVFRPAIDRNSETAFCSRCGAGVSITNDTAAISASEPLTRACVPTGVQTHG